MQQPAVSIGLPVYNGEGHLPRAIESFLAQTYTDLEIIVSDNASTDRTRAICLEYQDLDPRVRYLRHDDNKGAAANFNIVAELARGKYFKWAAHDDWCAPEFIRRCVEVLDEDPGLALCFTNMGVAGRDREVFRRVTYDTEVLDSSSVARRFRWMLSKLKDCTSPVFGVMRREVLKRTEGIRNVPEPDRVLLAELSLYGRFRVIPEPLFVHYGPPGHTSHDGWTWLHPDNVGRPKMAIVRVPRAYAHAVSRTDLSAVDKALLYGSIAEHVLLRPAKKVRGEVRRRWRRRSQRYRAGTA